MAKKFTKILAMLLVLATLLSMVSIGAFAAETEGCYIPQAPTAVGNNYPLNKTATALKDDKTTVTLSVPAEEVSLGVDIIYVAGAYLKKDQVENDLMVESLYSTFKEAIAAGVPVSFGFVPFSYDDKPVMELTKYDTVEKLESDFRNDLRAAIDEASGKYGGENMENALRIAKNMFAASELADHPERQHLVLVSSGHTYNFNVGNNNDIFSTVPVAIAGSEKAGKYFYGYKAWMQARNKNPNNYPIPKPFSKNNDYRDWEAYWEVIDRWATADVADGDKVVYNILDTTDYSFGYYDWYDEAYCGSDSKHDGTNTFKSFGVYIHTATELALKNGYDFADAPRSAHGSMLGNTIDNVPAAAQHAISYERAMWEASNFIDEQITGSGINFYSIYNQMNYKYTNGYRDTNVSWTQQYIGHSFMDMLARNAGMEKAIDNSTATDKAFFDPIKEAILYTVSADSKVTDAIGYDATEGNFEFVTDPATIKMSVNGVQYTTNMTAESKDGDKVVSASYDFLDANGKCKFSLDYYYGDGKEGEHFDWNFHTDVSMKERVALTYDLTLIDKSDEAGKHTVDTNRFAVLYPQNSEGEEGIPQLFPVPEVEYEVNPYDVDIVLGLGAGIAQYDADSTKGTNTYDAIVKLVEPLINEGINVKLGLVAVEHYKEEAMPLTVLTKDNYKQVIIDGLDTIQNMPAGPTNLEGVINTANEMLALDTAVPAENKFFHVIATGRTYCFDDGNGDPATIINQVTLKNKIYYYWGHYLWQSQRGGHTSLYMIPARYNNDFNAYWADVCKWVEADGDTYAYSFPTYDEEDSKWFVDYTAKNTTDAKALKLASSRFGWIFRDPEVEDEDFATTLKVAAIGSGSNPQNALNYERAQYDAYQAFKKMKDAGYNCYALCSENTSYQNGSPYIQIAKYTGTSTIQLGHSFMNFLNGGEAPLLFVMTDPNTGASEMAKEFFTPVDVDKLVKSEGNKDTNKVPMFAARPKFEGPAILTQPVDAKGALGETVSVFVEVDDPDATYQWYFRNAGAKDFSKSSTKTAIYEVEMTKERAGRELYCVITDVMGNKITTDTVKLIRVAAEELAIVSQPADAEGVLGETVSVQVEAKGEGLKYRWYFKDADAKSFSASSITTDTYEVELTKARAGRELYCVITDVVGDTVTSKTVKLVRVAAEKLEIVDQPVDDEGALGETVCVQVNAKGEGLKYRWYFKDADAKKFSASSITTDTYEVELTKARAGRELYCVITDALGNTVTTDTVKLIRVAAEELEIVAQPEDVEGTLGETVSVTVKAKGEGLKYQWYFCNAGEDKFYASSIKTDTYETELNESRVDRQVYCVITDALGERVESDIATLLLAEEEPADPIVEVITEG